MYRWAIVNDTNGNRFDIIKDISEDHIAQTLHGPAKVVQLGAVIDPPVSTEGFKPVRGDYGERGGYFGWANSKIGGARAAAFYKALGLKHEMSRLKLGVMLYCIEHNKGIGYAISLLKKGNLVSPMWEKYENEADKLIRLWSRGD